VRKFVYSLSLLQKTKNKWILSGMRTKKVITVTQILQATASSTRLISFVIEQTVKVTCHRVMKKGNKKTKDKELAAAVQRITTAKAETSKQNLVYLAPC
jgi:hypothetical protein